MQILKELDLWHQRDTEDTETTNILLPDFTAPNWDDIRASQVALVLKNPPANAEDIKRCRFNSWIGKIPWRRAWQPTSVFLPGESHGQRSLAGYGP